MRILVTGASGFIGGHVAQGLRRRHEVHAPSHAELDLCDDAAVEAWLRRLRPDVVVHAAMRGGQAVLPTVLEMQANLLRHRSLFGRLLWFGSGAEFDKSRDLVRVPETALDARVPIEPYGLAKWFATHASSGPRVVNLRLFGVFGPGEGHLFKFISNSIVKALAGMPIRIRQDVRFSYLWIEDLLPVVEHFVVHEARHHHYNVVPDETCTLLDLVGAIEREVGGELVQTIDTPGLNFEYTGDNRRLREELPSLDFTPLGDAIAALVAHYRARLPELDFAQVSSDEFARRARVRA